MEIVFINFKFSIVNSDNFYFIVKIQQLFLMSKEIKFLKMVQYIFRITLKIQQNKILNLE